MYTNAGHALFNSFRFLDCTRLEDVVYHRAMRMKTQSLLAIELIQATALFHKEELLSSGFEICIYIYICTLFQEIHQDSPDSTSNFHAEGTRRANKESGV